MKTGPPSAYLSVSECDFGVHTIDWRDHIASDPNILVGKPTVKGTRIFAELILGWLANGWTHEMILESYPQILRDEIRATLAFAA